MPGRLQRLSTVDTARTRVAPRPRLRPRGLPPALEPHGVYAAADAAEAALFGRDLLGLHRVHVEGDPAEFVASFHGVLLRDVTIGYLDYSTAVRVSVHQLPDDQLVIVPASGSSTIDVGGERIETSPVVGALPTPRSALELDCPADTAHLVLRIDRTALDVHLSRLLGRTLDEPVRFEPRFDLTVPHASRWNFAVQMLHAELLDQSSLLHDGAGIGQLEEFLMSSLLHGQASNYRELLVHERPQQRRAVRDAVRFIERNLARPLTVAEIATSAGVGVRSLQQMFHDDLAQSPIQYVRSRRLDRARADLADASPATTTVTDVASRWGFTHLGRFAVEYRSRFGERPSRTLRT